MKKLITIFLVMFLISCISNDKYEDYNINPNNPSEVDAALLFNSATKSLSNAITTPNINLNIFRLLAQYWSTTTYPDESNYFLTIRNIPQNFWAGIYKNVLLDLKTASDIVQSDNSLSDGDKTIRLAQAEVLNIYAWQLLVDTFGNVPYSQSLITEDYPLPAYDDAATIYEDLIIRLDVAINYLNGNGNGYEIDNLFFGDIDAWHTFAFSLKLRLGIRLSDVNPTLAQNTVESAYSMGVFTSNSDNAEFEYLSTSNPNPIWADIVQSGRQDFVAANTVIDIMNTLDDPRRAIYFDENLGPDDFKGGPYGDINTYSLYTHLGEVLLEPTFPAILIDYAEVSFYLAEAAERGYNVGGTAETYYNQAIAASFEYWGVPSVADYLSNPEVDYATAAGEWRQKIGQQFWLAMYNRGFEGWTAWRTYDVPTLNLPALTENPVPTRYTYPVNEQTLNETNWINGSTAIGGDERTTKLFWDTR